MTPEGALIINNIQSLDQGTYTCIVENTVGRTEASASVRVVCKFTNWPNSKRSISYISVQSDIFHLCCLMN